LELRRALHLWGRLSLRVLAPGAFVLLRRSLDLRRLLDLRRALLLRGALHLLRRTLYLLRRALYLLRRPLHLLRRALYRRRALCLRRLAPGVFRLLRLGSIVAALMIVFGQGWGSSRRHDGQSGYQMPGCHGLSPTPVQGNRGAIGNGPFERSFAL
jgi:hypothetical protein